ncbi:MAG: recombinase family protein [Eubacteriales bacterium]|nr:recombinase family protein [Eubacteriales bacterium]
MKAKQFYNVAIYLRLSRDDEDLDGGKLESNSISSQRDMIRSYIRKQDDMEIYDIYVDDGWSGANFDRPEFKRMMRDIEAGKIDCVIVKDLSRLGRDYIEAGRLIQKTFPAFSVRFIALTDHFDSLTADFNEKMMVVPVKNFMNEFYCRDISTKVRSHQQEKREEGKYIGAFCTYGYKKSSENRNVLVPDEYAAGVVRKVFAWKIDGYSNLAIAEKLDESGILSPMEYKKVQGSKLHTTFATNSKSRWSAVAVKRILTNETYIGTVVQGRAEKVNYKVNKCVLKPEEEWVRVKYRHEAIVSEEDFYIVQELLKIDTRAGSGTKKAHMFSGLLFCGDCMEPMTRRVNRYKGAETVSFICSTRNNGGECSRHSISEADLNHLILSALQQQIALFLDRNKVLQSIEQVEIQFEEVVAFDHEITKLHQEQDKYLKLRAGLYEDLKNDIITESDFKNFREIYEKRYQELQKAIEGQEDTVKKLFQSGLMAGKNLERMKMLMQVTELDRSTLITFVRRILVYEDKRVYVELRYKELFSKAIMLADYVESKQIREEAV